jgi:molybdopterin-guanine dinucleotide biosynthesis protein A
VLGAVLAGGRSSRFGSPKALAPFRGEPMVARAFDALAPVCEEVVVVTHLAEIGIALGARTLRDRVADAGPLGGLHAALHDARARGRAGVLLLGCDMPLVPPALLALLVDEGRARGAAAVAPAPGSGSKHLQPLCAWYSAACLEWVAARLDAPDGDRSLHGLLEAAHAHLVPRERLCRVCDPDVVFRGANTPAELSELEDVHPWPVSRSPRRPFSSSPSAFRS